MKFRIGNSNRPGRGIQSAGGGCLILFGLVFAGAGLAGTFFIGKMALEEAATYSWTETPCTVESVEIEDEVSNENPFTMVVRYAYEFGGQRYSSEQYSLQGNRSDSYESLALKRKELLTDDARCFVDPEDPSNAVIERKGITTGLMALFPLIFVVIGGLIVWGGIASLRKSKAAKAGGGGVESISAGAKGGNVAGWKIGAVVGAVFFLVGAGLLYPLGIGPLSKMLSSQQWMETPCTVIWSTVRRHESTDSDGHTSVTYSVDIFYEYEFNGQTHRSNNYGFFGGSSSGRSAKQKIVREYKKGSEQVCYVNPELPEQAVLKAGLSWSALLGLLPLVFLLVGALVLVASVRSGARKKERDGRDARDGKRFRQHWQDGDDRNVRGTRSTDSAAESDTGPRVLQPAGSRLAKTGGCLLFALFWNGIVSVFVFQAVKGIREGSPEWFLIIFLIPFVLVGIGFILGFFYQLLALANPRPVLTLTPGTVRLGEPFEIRWQLHGSASRLSEMKLSLWGIEAATYRRGTNTHTSNEVFFSCEFVSTNRLAEMQSGTASVTIPGDLMYSFDAGNNEIKYELRIAGDVPFWPDIGDTYVIDVRPSLQS